MRRLFRNCRLVGRRFRLAHVFFGREIIEVATFRATSAPSQGDEPLPEADPEDGEAPELDDDAVRRVAAEPVAPARGRGAAGDDSDDSAERAFDASGRMLRDNVYGTIDEDVWRRDFTANSLYYNIADFSLWDYVDGTGRHRRAHAAPDRRPRDPLPRRSGAHAARGALRGEAGLRDRRRPPPPRLHRCADCWPACRRRGSSMRLLKLFLTGHGARSFGVLRQPRPVAGAAADGGCATSRSHPGSLVEKLLLQGLRNTDARVDADKPVTPTFLFALLLIWTDRRPH